MRPMVKSSSLPKTCQQPSITPGQHTNGVDTSKVPRSFPVAKMSDLTYENSLTCNISATASTHHVSSQTYLTMSRCLQPENCTNLAQLKITDGKWNKSYNSDSNLELGNSNMKLNGKVMNIKTTAESMLKIWMSS